MHLAQRYGIVIVAAGRGERAAGLGSGPKQYRMLGGIPLIARTIDAFRVWNGDCPIVIVRHADDDELLKLAISGREENASVVIGGATRQASVLCGLESLAALDGAPHFAFIHDAARPFVPTAMLDAIVEALEENPDNGVLPAMPVAETLKSASADGHVLSTVPRAGLHRAQTPQAFPLSGILDVHRRAAAECDSEFTDDAALYEWAGLPVRLVAGDNRNIKLTWPQDFEDAERMLHTDREPALPDVRVGHGYDTHQMVAGDRIILCGVEIPHDRRLSGHSDADVGFHALTDALLATIGAGDIGSHFPPSDPQWKGAASHRFLSHAAELVRDAGGRITHCDVTLLCEAPKIGPHREIMRQAIAKTVGVDVSRTSVKATTNERIGFVGREEGIVALATATVVMGGQ
ncbi:bifunctional 2-C-methyl-D-erythritol 4-phosphate cytidylyltransferase/2-C-methyl-D-erythritol 2,4-cyclodiphosphate synthase [Oricola sp.]|uniref:bifunctional 2-C-methyl-D-erythritol 4-phosphate cytidylyltransferase/2-C-methyl-D-erythritol 2,4-cyclodiphosphate synthase n=1 Tax=Oricola sp. TaxID=1979950 RepID=UPI000C95197C|nr:bifunctional 2-C-methyl-D-erythritol 4-phosphate cytidylyltransferase/2-C-methyl-D-erythritol 2,4-cyclodiphosphate synthase [Ahrensia sp.]|tara:strand:- start:3800 stop:5011 length:1212 start_codon:yes stop_codon:yes gene_type:complete